MGAPVAVVKDRRRGDSSNLHVHQITADLQHTPAYVDSSNFVADSSSRPCTSVLAMVISGMPCPETSLPLVVPCAFIESMRPQRMTREWHTLRTPAHSLPVSVLLVRRQRQA